MLEYDSGPQAELHTVFYLFALVIICDLGNVVCFEPGEWHVGYCVYRRSSGCKSFCEKDLVKTGSLALLAESRSLVQISEVRKPF